VLGEATVSPGDVVLEIRAVPDEGHFSSTALGPDQVVAGVVGPDGGFTELGRLDGRYLSTEVAGGMTGRLLGVWCSRGELLVRSFTYAGSG
jgi:xylan 1,4-beta-xylosidase